MKVCVPPRQNHMFPFHRAASFPNFHQCTPERRFYKRLVESRSTVSSPRPRCTCLLCHPAGYTMALLGKFLQALSLLPRLTRKGRLSDIVDAGGGTIDLSAYRKTEKRGFEEFASTQGNYTAYNSLLSSVKCNSPHWEEIVRIIASASIRNIVAFVSREK